MVTVIGKILSLLPLILTNGIGLIQALIKIVKEIFTLIINLVFPFTPDNGKFEFFVLKMRDKFNKFSDWFDGAKTWLLKIAGVLTDPITGKTK